LFDTERSILTDAEIVARLIRGSIVITPLIDPEQIGATSVDLRLGPEFAILRRTYYGHLDFARDQDTIRRDVQRYTQRIQVKALEPFVIHPGEFALGATLEFISLPNDLTGFLEGRSTWGRLGLQVHSTASFVDPRFNGNLVFELQNVGKVPIELYAGLRIAQISFNRSSGSIQTYAVGRTQHYKGQLGPVGSKFYLDRDFERINHLLKTRLPSPGKKGP
jgi:dCTP deaminase